MDVVVFPAGLLVSQVEIDLKPLQGRISQFRLGNRRRQPESVDLDDSTSLYQSYGRSNLLLDTHISCSRLQETPTQNRCYLRVLPNNVRLLSIM
jgi:hypothetical protein